MYKNQIPSLCLPPYSFHAVHPSVCPSVHLSVRPSVHLSICHDSCVLNRAKTPRPISLKLGGDFPWECLRNCLHFGPCDLIFKVKRSPTKTILMYMIQPAVFEINPKSLVTSWVPNQNFLVAQPEI